MPPIVKTLYLLRRKSCARFGLDFSRYLLCQVKNPDEINTRHVYLLEKNKNKPQIHLNKLEFIAYIYLHFGALGVQVAHQQFYSQK